MLSVPNHHGIDLLLSSPIIGRWEQGRRGGWFIRRRNGSYKGLLRLCRDCMGNFCKEVYAQNVGVIHNTCVRERERL